jgi:DNA-binding IclR family transcriptional regulator
MTANRATESSVGRALRVVEVVAELGDGVTPKAIARRLGFTLPTTYRLLATLVTEGYLVRLREPGGYGLGYRFGALARRLADQIAVPWTVRTALHEVHRDAGAASHYTVFRDVVTVLAHLDSCPHHAGAEPLRVGEPVPAHTTAAGKVLLAALTPRRLAQVLALPADDRAVLNRELLRVRELGAAVELAELVPGWAGVAAPVRNRDGSVMGALGLSLGRAELAARRAELERLVRDGARRVGMALAEQEAAG